MSDEVRRLRRWDVATLVAIVGLLVTMVFNTMSARQSADQAKHSAEQARLGRIDSQAVMLTSLSSYLQRTNVALERLDADALRCNAVIEPSSKQRAAILTQLAAYDYLAWLFNQETWTMNAAKRYWGPSILRAHEIATGVFEVSDVQREFRELDHFRRVTSRQLRLQPMPC
jgi:hypothetical protein